MRLWIKLHVQLLDDPKVAVMADPLFRTFINLMAIAGRVDENGKLGSSADIAYWLRKELGEVEAQMLTLEKCNVCVTKDGVWKLKNWNKFNKVAASNKPKAIRERVQKYRENKAKTEQAEETRNEDVTRYKRDSNAYRKEKNREEKKENGADAPSAPDPVKELAAVFEQAAGISLPGQLKGMGAKTVGVTWWNPLREMVKMANGGAGDILKTAVINMRRDRLTIAAPISCLKVFTSLHGERKAPAQSSKFIDYS